MKGKVPRLRLSPNEEARIIREEYERRRKLRLQQVRDQQRLIALKIRRAVEERREHELEQLGKELRDEWERQQREKINTLQKLYHESLQLLGQGQRSAKENEPDWEAIAQREEENQAKAEERFQEALKELKSQRLQDHERQSRSINARKKALKAEKERSARVASLPLPPPNPIQNIDFKKQHRIRKSDVSAFATTYYHMVDRIVDREADQIQPNAHEEAEVELKRLQEMEMEEMRRKEEQLEKAHLRGKQALRREHLEQDRERLLVELEHMQQTDLLRRRQQMAKMPPQIFQPLYKRTEMKEDFQRQMEFAFEDMYTGERRGKGDLVVQLLPEPLPEMSAGSQDQELDVTMDEVAPPLSLPDPEERAGRSEQESSTQAEQTKPAPKHPLKKLLDRIRSQRNQWTDHDRAADMPAVVSDEIPEKDTTIDTGSLTSEEKSSVLPVELHKTTHHASETSERSTVAETHLSEELTKRHDERKKQDEKLEREKLEQLALLQELEEQKAKLEQMLQRSQQDRNQLKVVVTHEEHQPESFESHEVSSAETTDLVPSPDEDDHARQIREYQHQLLERSRIHQRSVEVARQRLEVYQRALQMRYNIAAKKAVPSHQPPLLCLWPSQAAAGLSHFTKSLVQTSAQDKAQLSRVIPARETVLVREPPPPDSRAVTEVESFLSNTSHQATDVSTSLEGGTMESITERLQETMIPVTVTKEPHEQLPSTSIPSAIQSICPSITDVPVQDYTTPVQTGALPQDSEYIVSHKDHSLRQREEQQPHSQRQQTHEWEMEQMRQQKRYLQALIHSDAQSGPLLGAKPEEHVSDNVSQTRRNLLESLLKVIEQRNGGTLSHLEDAQSDKGQASDQDEPLSPEGEVEGSMLESLDQRKPGELYPEEKKQGWETDMEFMGQQKETFQAVSEPATEESASEDIDQIRRTLFASLLKAIAESRGAVSQSETSLKEDKTVCNSEPLSHNLSAGPSPASINPEGRPFPLQPTRPPVTRVRSGVWEMSQQHELSAIAEVETPVNISLATGLEDSLRLRSRDVDQDPLEDSDSTLQSSSGERIFEKSANSETSSGSSSHLIWTERLLRSLESSPQCSISDSKTMSPLSSDSGRGADYSGPAVTTLRSPTETPLGAACPESDCLSTTTISTGSYITTDPEQNSEKSPTLIRVGQGPELLAVFSPPSESICMKDSSAAESPHLAVERLFSDSGIQRIIDKYTKELNFSLCSPGRPAESAGLDVEPLGASATEPSPLSDLEGSEADRPVPSDNAAAPGDSLQLDSAVQEQDSFRPLIGQPADQSSCLDADQRHSAMERLVGHPSAHSSLIGQLPGLPISTLDRSDWDSTLTRMISRLAHQSSPQWQTGGRDPDDPRPLGQLSPEHPSSWFEGGPEESQMRPLVEELDASAGQQTRSPGERTRADPGGADEVTVASHPEFPPTTSVLDTSPHPQARTVPADPCPERSEVWDSFHPLMAEVAHNETVDPSMTFDQPEDDSPDPRAPTSLNYDDPSEPLEFFRDKDPVTSVTTPPASDQSFSLLITSQDRVRESLVSPSLKVDLELMATSLSQLPGCSDASVVNTSEPEEPGRSGSVKLTPEEGSRVLDAVSEKVDVLLQSQDSDEKGILEQSQITLVSLTDTSLQEEWTLTDEAGSVGGDPPDEETESLFPAQTHENSQTLPATLLELDWGSSGGLQDVCQQKRKLLIQRSSQRVEELKSRRAQTRSRSDVRKQLQNQSCRPGAKLDPRLKAGQAECSQTALNSGSSQHKITPAEAPVVDARVCSTGQRRLEVSEMHQRTRRLYEQLEEVKQQRAVKSRQEASTQNRLKAKEFHKKTLQKLRAKQMLR